MGDRLLILLLRFVVELKWCQGGWVNRHTLQSESIVPDSEGHQIYGRLRKAVEPSLLNRCSLDFIQNDGAKSYRMSTHPDFVTYDCRRLLTHSSRRVQMLAGRLP